MHGRSYNDTSQQACQNTADPRFDLSFSVIFMIRPKLEIFCLRGVNARYVSQLHFCMQTNTQTLNR